MKKRKLSIFCTIIAISLILGTLLCSCAAKQMPMVTATQDDGDGTRSSINTSRETASENQSSSFDTEEEFSITSQDRDNLVSEECIESQIKASIGIPFRFWNSQSQELHCISFFDTYAKREVARKITPEYEEQDNLTWNITGKKLSITGTWNENFQIDISAKTATSLSDGMVYDIVPGNIIAESNSE